MPIYTLTTIRPPTITLQHHTFTLRVYQQFTTPEGPQRRAIGEIVFQKPAEEPWSAARTRFRTTVSAWIATYEQAHQIHQAVATWLETQEWET